MELLKKGSVLLKYMSMFKMRRQTSQNYKLMLKIVFTVNVVLSKHLNNILIGMFLREEVDPLSKLSMPCLNKYF